MKRLFSLLSVLLFVAACGAPAAAPTDGASSDDAAAVAATPHESVLRASFSWPTFIDPAVGNDFSSSTALANLYDGLVFPNADGTVSPWLATAWESSEDGLLWTVTLRDDVTFHDGSAMAASDVVYSFNRLKTVGEG